MSGPGYTITKDEATGTELFVELDSRGRLELYCQHEGHGFTIYLDTDEALELENVIDGHASGEKARNINRQDEERRTAEADERRRIVHEAAARLAAKRQEMVEIARLNK